MSDKKKAQLEKESLKLLIDFNWRASGIPNQLKEIHQRKNGSDRTNDSRIKVGDWVKFTNEYRYIKKGIVIEVRKFNKPGNRLCLKDLKGDIYQRAPWNVEKTKKAEGA